MRGTAKYLTFLPILLGAILIIISCSKQETPTNNTLSKNHVPQIVSLSANPSVLSLNQKATLVCIATDEDGDKLTYTWSASRGALIQTTGTIQNIWIPPSSSGKDTIFVMVGDGIDSIRASVELFVGSVPRSPSLSLPKFGSRDVDVSPIFKWNKIKDAESYSIMIEAANTDRFVRFKNEIKDTSFQITELAHYTDYYWKVSATNKLGTSLWSEANTFRTSAGACPGAPTINYKGKVYNTVQIGTLCWLKENLNLGTMISGNTPQLNNGVIEKYCYNNDENNCEKYGGLYQWSEAMAYSQVEGGKGICPEGWHIPTYNELSILYYVNGGVTLSPDGQGTGGTIATNPSGFSAIASGIRSSDSEFLYLGEFINFWSSKFDGMNGPFNYNINFTRGYAVLSSNPGNAGLSIRCVKD